MVYRKRRYRRRRKGRRRRTNRRRRLPYTHMKVSGPAIFPDVTYTKLIYTDNYVFNTTTDQVTEQIFRGNSINDPDLTGVGHQALGHDWWKAFYSKYCVLACKIEVRYSSSTQTSNSLTNFGIVPSLSSSAISSSDIDIYNEQPYAKYKITGGSNASSGKGYIKHYMTTKRMFGRRNIEDDVFEGTFDANPGSNWYWLVYCGTIDESSDIDMTFNVKLTYYTKCLRRVTATSVQ